MSVKIQIVACKSNILDNKILINLELEFHLMLNLSIIEIIYTFHSSFQGASTNELAGDRYDINKQDGTLIIKDVIKDDEGLYKCDARNEADSVVVTAMLNVISKKFFSVNIEKTGI